MNRIRLSHNANKKLKVCERLFQFDRLLKGFETRDDTPHTVFGKAFGAAVQHYICFGDMDAAIWLLYLTYTPWLEDDNKTFSRCVMSLIRFQDELDKVRDTWEVVSFKGRLANELGFNISIDETYYYVGFVDLVLRHKVHGYYAILDVKTTQSWLKDLAPLYKNSDQGLGYSIILDAVVGEELASYSVLYLVLQIPTKGEDKMTLFEFRHTLLDRLQWFLTLQMDVNHIRQMRQFNHFPKRGDACIQYNRPCQHFGVCHMHSQDTEREDEPDPHEADYQFHYSLNDLINSHLERAQLEQDTQVTLLG